MTVRKLSELHDAHLVGIIYQRGEAITLEFRIDESTTKTMTLKGVAHFFCSGMLEANIVESVEILDWSDISHDDLKYFVDRERRHQTVEKLSHTISTQKLSMVLMAASYGAELGSVCSVVVTE